MDLLITMHHGHATEPTTIPSTAAVALTDCGQSLGDNPGSLSEETAESFSDLDRRRDSDERFWRFEI